jgi:hypothetical protein
MGILVSRTFAKDDVKLFKFMVHRVGVALGMRRYGGAGRPERPSQSVLWGGVEVGQMGNLQSDSRVRY